MSDPEKKSPNHPLGCFDAEEWQKEFNVHLVSRGEQPFDPDTLRAWFANAIMTGYDEGHRKVHASRDPEVEHLEAAIKCLRLLKDQAKAEVADLKKDLSLNASLLAKQCDLAREAEGECEKLKSSTKEKFSCPCGETTYLLERNPNHFVGCISHNPTEVEDLKSQIESWKRTAGEAGKNWQQSAEASNELLEQLEAEREASRKLVEAARLHLDDEPCSFDHHGNCQTHRVSNPCEMALLREALKLYATPGHSPEGKTL